jgi:hypothetical protein
MTSKRVLTARPLGSDAAASDQRPRKIALGATRTALSASLIAALCGESQEAV